MESNGLYFKKIWEDDTIFELKIEIKSSCAISHVCCYVDKNLLNELKELANQFLSERKSFTWCLSKKSDGNIDYTPYFSLCIDKIDLKGNISVSIEMDNNKVDIEKMVCITSIATEIGLFEQFLKRLNSFIREDIIEFDLLGNDTNGYQKDGAIVML